MGSVDGIDLVGEAHPVDDDYIDRIDGQSFNLEQE